MDRARLRMTEHHKSIAILVSGGIGVYHVGVEQGIFIRTCGGTCNVPPEQMMECVMRPKVACDAIQFQFLGISMAGWNAIISVLSALVILWLPLQRSRIRN